MTTDTKFSPEITLILNDIEWLNRYVGKANFVRAVESDEWDLMDAILDRVGGEVRNLRPPLLT